MKCPNCKTKLPTDCKFCPHCGSEILLDIKCPKCGESNPLNAKFCKNCGTRFENNKDEDIKKPIEKSRVESILAIIALSSLFLSLLLMIGFAFIPTLSDSFFPGSVFTVIGYSKDVLRRGFTDLINNYRYVDIANSFLLIGGLAAIVIVGIIFVVIDSVKFSSSLNEYKSLDLRKHTLILFSIFTSVHIYASVVYRSAYQYQAKFNPLLLILVVFVLISVIFATFVNEFSEDRHELKPLLFRAFSRFLITVFAATAVFFVGGRHFSVRAIIQVTSETTKTVVFKSGGLGIIDFIAKNSKDMYVRSMPYQIESAILSALSFAFEIASLIFILTALKTILTKNVKDKDDNLSTLIQSVISFVLFVTAIILNIINKKNMLEVSNLDIFGANIRCVLNNSKLITATVMSGLVMAIIIAMFVIEKIWKRRGNDNEA